MEIIFIRHGQTDWNKAGRKMGQQDIELNQEGIKQSQAVMAQLKNDFDVIYSSPLKRAQKMAQMIADNFQVPLILDDKLMEVNYGSLAGKTADEIKSQTGLDLENTNKNFYDYRPYGGENSKDLQNRVVAFFENLVKKPHKKVLIVTHRGIIRAASHLFFKEEKNMIENGSIHTFNFFMME